MRTCVVSLRALSTHVVALALCLASLVPWTPIQGPGQALAARSQSPEQSIVVKLEPSQPTAVALPEPVASVSVGVAPERFSLDYDGPYLFLLPLDPTVTGRLFVVGQSGKLYIVIFKVGTPADDVVHVTAATASLQTGTTTQPFSVASLLRALRTGTAVPGQQTVDIPPPALPDTRLSLTGSSALALGTMIGLVVTLRNTQTTPLALDLRIGEAGPAAAEGMVALSAWTWPPRLTIRAVAADTEVVGPEGQTRVYVVFERRP
jgi:hypothetical protein